MPNDAYFLSTETPLQVAAGDSPAGARWAQVAGSGIARPALLLATGESATGGEVRIVPGTRLLLRYGAAAPDDGDPVELRIELCTRDARHVVARLPVDAQAPLDAIREIRLALDPWAGLEARVRVSAHGRSGRFASSRRVAVYELAVAQEEALPLVAARAFRAERTANELAHFAAAYDHAMYHGAGTPRAPAADARCSPLEALVEAWTARPAAAAPAPPAFPPPDALPEALRDPFHYTHHLLGQALQARPPDFHGRLARLAADRPLRILSLCSGAARIEAGMAPLAGTAAHWTLMDLNESLLRTAAANFPEGVVPDLIVGDLNTIRDFGVRYDVIMCVSGLHHIVELERVLDFISAALADGGEFWSIGEAIGRNGNRLWGRALDAANACFTPLPARLRRNHHTGVVDERLPDDDYGSGTFEGIRSQDILPLLTDRLDPVDVYRRNCFLWRLVNQAYNGNYDMSDPEDVARLQGFVLAELAHFRDGGRPTELHGVFRKRLL